MTPRSSPTTGMAASLAGLWFSGLGVDYVTSFMQYGPSWKWQNYDYSVVQNAERLRPGNATGNDFNLEPFNRDIGKLLIYHSMANQLISTGSSFYLYS
jgi:feruloyl esterase